MELSAPVFEIGRMPRHGPYGRRKRKFPGNYLEDWRLYRNLTQAQLAERASVSEATVSSIENGAGFGKKTLQRLALALECRPGDLLSYPPPGPADAIFVEKWRALEERDQRRILTMLEEWSSE